MSSPTDDAAVVVTTLAVVASVVVIAWLSWALATRDRLLSRSRRTQWARHTADVVGPAREDAAAVADTIRRSLRAAGLEAAVYIQGSIYTGSARKSSDIDVVVEVKTCDQHDAVAAHLVKAAHYGHVHSGGMYTLLTGRSPGGRAVDVSVTTPAKTSSDPLPPHGTVQARGYFEHIVRTDHPQCTIRKFE